MWGEGGVSGVNEDYKSIGICAFDCKLFEEEKAGGVQEVINGYPYFKYRVKLWPGDWVEQL